MATARRDVGLPVRLDQCKDRITAVLGKRAGRGSHYCRKKQQLDPRGHRLKFGSLVESWWLKVCVVLDVGTLRA